MSVGQQGVCSTKKTAQNRNKNNSKAGSGCRETEKLKIFLWLARECGPNGDASD